MKVVIFTEGGGERGQPQVKNLAIHMRQAFKTFLMNAKIPQEHIEIRRCGSRVQAYQLFATMLKKYQAKQVEGEIPLLLVDSEDPVSADSTAWGHLRQRDGWAPPPQTRDEHAHLMTQCMEAWFLADTQVLVDYYGNGFNINALPRTHPIEEARKEAILSGLAQASENTTKGPYSKGGHAFALLERMDPTKVQQASPWACRLLRTLDDIIVHHKLGKSARPCQLPRFPQPSS